MTGLFSLSNYEQPVVEPQLTHFKQLPLETKVNCPHSGQGSPSNPNFPASSTTELSGESLVNEVEATDEPPKSSCNVELSA